MSEKRKGWHKHPNGGGWVEDSAKVDESCYVGPDAWISGNAQVYGYAQVSGDARVSGNAQVYGDARVSGNAQVYGDAWVYGNAQVYGDAWISGNARVYGYAQVYGDARVSGYACVSGDARVYGYTWEQSPLYIQGTRHALTNSRKGHIAIGCHDYTFAYWKKHYKAIGRKEGYGKEQIEEYGAYIELFCKVGK